MEASSALLPQSNHGIMDDDEDELAGSMLSSSFCDDDEEPGECSSNSMGSTSSSDLTEDAASSVAGPLFEMSSLFSQLPFKRGLSIHFEGKSQSFTSMSDARSLEDLAKPDKEMPLTKMTRRRKSYNGWGLQGRGRHNKHKVARAIAKKSSRDSFIAKRTSNFLRNSRRPLSLSPPPPPPPAHSCSTSSGISSTTGETLLFA